MLCWLDFPLPRKTIVGAPLPRVGDQKLDELVSPFRILEIAELWGATGEDCSHPEIMIAATVANARNRSFFISISPFLYSLSKKLSIVLCWYYTTLHYFCQNPRQIPPFPHFRYPARSRPRFLPPCTRSAPRSPSKITGPPLSSNF